MIAPGLMHELIHHTFDFREPLLKALVLSVQPVHFVEEHYIQKVIFDRFRFDRQRREQLGPYIFRRQAGIVSSHPSGSKRWPQRPPKLR